MYYYTKEWYLRSKCTGTYLNLRPCTAEEARSAEFYEKELAIFTEEIRFECEQIKNTSYDVFAEDRTESEELLKAEFDRRIIENDPRDADFIAAKRLSERIAALRLALPEELLSEIPDIRIFALNRADEKTTELVTEYSEECRRFMQETDFRFEEEYPARTEPIPSEIWEEYGFAGGRIKKIVRSGRDISIYIDNAGSGSDVTAMHLKDVDTQRLDEGLEGALWIANEMYLVNGEYELCALCRNGNNFPEFILHTRDISFDFDR